MNTLTKFLLCALTVSGLFLITGCSDSADTTAKQQQKPVTKEEVKEAIQEASQPGQFTKDAMEAFEKDRDKIREQMKGYTAEDRERKKIEAQKEYEEFQRKKAEREAQKNKSKK